MKYYLKKLLGHEKFRTMISWATNFFLKSLCNPPTPRPPPTYLMYAPLTIFVLNDPDLLLLFRRRPFHLQLFYEKQIYIYNVDL